jgi:hypothetical protein
MAVNCIEMGKSGPLGRLKRLRFCDSGPLILQVIFDILIKHQPKRVIVGIMGDNMSNITLNHVAEMAEAKERRGKREKEVSGVIFFWQLQFW